MAVPKKKIKDTEIPIQNDSDIPKGSVKYFEYLFEFEDDNLVCKRELIIGGKLYKSGEIITETTFPTFDLLENPDKYRYSVNGKTLIGRIPNKIT